MYPVGTGTEEDFRKRWYIAQGFGEKTNYGYHEGLDINLKSGGDTDLGENILAIKDYKLVYYHLKSHIESGFGVHFVYEIETKKFGKVWIHCAHVQKDPPIASKKEGKAGDVIAHIGKTGRPRNIMPAHLHLSCFRVDPASLPKGIDTIAKTTKQLNEWWLDPLEVFESLEEDKMQLPDWFKTLLSERSLTLDNEGEFRAFWDKAIRYDDEVSQLKTQVASLSGSLSDRSLEVASLMERNNQLTTRVDEVQEQLNQARSKLSEVSWKAEKCEAEKNFLQENIENLNEKIKRFESKNSLYAYSWWRRFISLFKRG